MSVGTWKSRSQLRCSTVKAKAFPRFNAHRSKPGRIAVSPSAAAPPLRGLLVVMTPAGAAKVAQRRLGLPKLDNVSAERPATGRTTSAEERRPLWTSLESTQVARTAVATKERWRSAHACVTWMSESLSLGRIGSDVQAVSPSRVEIVP